MIIDPNALASQLASPSKFPNAQELRRVGKVFFVGGDLPVNQTLETMFESFCTESTDLFLLTFGSRDNFFHGEELARHGNLSADDPYFTTTDSYLGAVRIRPRVAQALPK